MQTTSSGVQEFSEEEERDDATPLTQGDADLLGLRRSSFCHVCYSERLLSLSVQSHDSHCASSKNVWTSSVSSSVLHSLIGWTSPEKVPNWASWVQPLVIRHRDSRVCRWKTIYCEVILRMEGLNRGNMWQIWIWSAATCLVVPIIIFIIPRNYKVIIMPHCYFEVIKWEANNKQY